LLPSLLHHRTVKTALAWAEHFLSCLDGVWHLLNGGSHQPILFTRCWHSRLWSASQSTMAPHCGVGPGFWNTHAHTPSHGQVSLPHQSRGDSRLSKLWNFLESQLGQGCFLYCWCLSMTQHTGHGSEPRKDLPSEADALCVAPQRVGPSQKWEELCLGGVMLEVTLFHAAWRSWVQTRQGACRMSAFLTSSLCSISPDWVPS
jgi:hypothetical protein